MPHWHQIPVIFMIYSLLSRNFAVRIYALYPQIFLDWKAKSADFYTFRMYGYISRIDDPFAKLVFWILLMKTRMSEGCGHYLIWRMIILALGLKWKLKKWSACSGASDTKNSTIWRPNEYDEICVAINFWNEDRRFIDGWCSVHWMVRPASPEA